MKLKQICAISAEYGLNIQAENYVDDGVPIIRTSDFDDLGRLDLKNAKNVTAIDAHGKILKKGDILFSRSGTVGRCMVFNLDTPCTFAAYLVRFRPKAGCADSKFIFYWSRSAPFRHDMSIETIESTIGNFNGKKFAALNFPNKTYDEQRVIADFLDEETSRIDKLIDAKQAMSARLIEKEFSLISSLLTKGLDATVSTKPAGVDWLDVMPAHWNWARMKDVCSRIIDCKNRTPPETADQEFFVVRTSCIKAGKFNLEGGYWTDAKSFAEWTKRGRPQADDVLFTREAPMGEACLAPEDLKFCLGQRMMIYRPNKSKIEPRYLVHTIYSSIGRSYIDMRRKGSTVGHLRVPEVYDFPCLLPPIEEQRAILSEIERRIGFHQELAQKVAASIRKLKEYRTSIITAAVTGRIDVADWRRRGKAERQVEAIEKEVAA